MAEQSEEVLVDVGGRTLRISNLGKVMYPVSGTTKGEVLNYYAQIAPVLLPLLKDRPVTRVRWPHGVEQVIPTQLALKQLRVARRRRDVGVPLSAP